jgi:hypothetical protein
MADLSDVENAIVAEAVTALYPNGTGASSVVGANCKVYRGWPIPAALNSDLSAGVINVTVFPAIKADEPAEFYLDRPYAAAGHAGLIASVAGQSVTFSGTVTVNLVVGLLVSGAPYIYNTTAGDTLQSVAANMAALIAVNEVVVLSGVTVGMPNARALVARVVENVSVSSLLRRERRDIQLISWCPSPMLRDQVCSSLDLAFAGLPFMALADQTQARVKYVSTQEYDQTQNASLYRRDLCYQFEYAMVAMSMAPTMLFGNLTTNAASLYI